MGTNAEEVAEELERQLTKACNAAMPSRGQRQGKKPMYWWTPAIKELRGDSIHDKRQLTRARGRGNKEHIAEARKVEREAKKALRRS